MARYRIPPGSTILWPTYLAPVANDLRPPGRRPYVDLDMAPTATPTAQTSAGGIVLPSLPDGNRCQCLIRTSVSLTLLQATYFSYTYWDTRNIREILKL